MEKIDGRKLKPEGRNQVRQLVIRLHQQSGMKAEELPHVAGVHVSTIRDGLARAEREGVGSLTEKPRRRRVGAYRKLTQPQIEPAVCPVDRASNRRTDSREIFGVTVQVRWIGKYPKRWDLPRNGR
jgi:transposase